MKIAITGGIGSGKSTVAANVPRHFPFYMESFSVDSIVAKLYENIDVQRALIEALGTADKKLISDAVFDNADIRNQVEHIFTPFVKVALEEILTNENFVIEFPLLFEKGQEYIDKFDVVIHVSVDENHDKTLRFTRVQQRNGFSVAKIASIINNQATNAQRDAISDYVIDNSSVDLMTLEYEVERTCDKIKLQMLRDGWVPKNTRIGIVSGSFDPITNGHSWIVSRALDAMDYVIVLIAQNPTKKYLFSESEREQIVRDTMAECISPYQHAKVIVDFLPAEQLLVTYARQFKKAFIFRGLRNFTDFEYETQLNLIQKKLEPSVETFYLITPRDLTEISSTMVKATLVMDEWEKIAKDYVPETVLRALKLKKVLK